MTAIVQSPQYECIGDYHTEIRNLSLHYSLFETRIESEMRYAYSISITSHFGDESESAHAYDITSMREYARTLFEMSVKHK